MNTYKLHYERTKPLVCSVFIDALETMRVKVFEGRKGNGDGWMPHIRQALEKSGTFERSHKVEGRRIVRD